VSRSRIRWPGIAWGIGVLCLVAACGEPADPLVEVRALEQEGRYGQMLEPLRRMIDRDPSRIEAHLLLGEALLNTGEAGLAVWSLQRASESPEYAVKGGMLLTQALLESRPGPDAIAAIDRVLALEPDNVTALSLRVDAYLANAKLEEALADMERVLELDPDNRQVLVPRVTALIGLERIEEAEVALAEARERVANIDEELPASLRARLCIAQGLFAFEKGEREAAEAQYEKCLEDFPTDRLAVTESVAFRDRLGEHARATEILTQAFERTDDGYFRIALARRMGGIGEPAEQERLLRAEAEARPSPQIWFALADFYVNQDRFEPALGAFERALELGDPPPMLSFAYADTLVQAGDYERAREVAERLEQPQLRNLIRGRILLAQGKPGAALAAFEAGLRLWPNNPAARYLAGQAAERVGLFDRAISEYRESLRANAAMTEAGLALAPLHDVQRDVEGALDAARNYIRTHPRDPEGLLVVIRIAHRAEREGVVREGLTRLREIPGQAANASVEEARQAAEQGGAAAAIAVLEAAQLDLTDPAQLPALAELVERLGEQAEHARARRRVDAALAAHPEQADFHALRGRVLRAAGAAADAQTAFQRALELEPAHAPALVGLAELAAASGDEAGALALYERALDADDAPAPGLAAARLELALGRPEAAITRLTALIDRHPRESEAALELARLLLAQGDVERARDYAGRAAWFHEPGSEETLAQIAAQGGEQSDPESVEQRGNAANATSG